MHCSGGQMRKFSVCAAMLAKDLIVLDEPTSGIDPMVSRKVSFIKLFSLATHVTQLNLLHMSCSLS